jgi:hypothetical protein
MDPMKPPTQSDKESAPKQHKGVPTGGKHTGYAKVKAPAYEGHGSVSNPGANSANITTAHNNDAVHQN